MARWPNPASIPASEKGAANGVASLGADSKVPAAQLPASSGGAAPNVVQARQATDFTSPNVAQDNYLQLGTIEPSLTIVAGSRLLVMVSGRVAGNAVKGLRLNIDNGVVLRNVGRQDPGNGTGDNMAITETIEGLAAGAHTVRVEFKKWAAGEVYLRASTQPELENLGILLWELPA